MKKGNAVQFYELWDHLGESIACYGNLDNLDSTFHSNFNENFHKGKVRNVYRETDVGAVRVITSVDDPNFSTSRAAQRSCEIYLSLIPHLKQIYQGHRQRFDVIIRRFAHNLIKFQTRFKDNFLRLISDASRSRAYTEFQNEVKRRIESNTSVAAEDICQLSHRAVDLDAQIETLRIISGFADKPEQSNFISVDILKTIYRLSNPFVAELKKRNVNIDLQIPTVVKGSDKVILDPSLFNAAIWQLLDNASKYVRNDTKVTISADLESNPKRLEIAMVSVKIDNDEVESLFREGRIGRNAGSKGQNGIGLFIVRKALHLMRAKIYIRVDGEADDYGGFKYSQNRFIIEFKH